jgi:hypothetical protein
MTPPPIKEMSMTKAELVDQVATTVDGIVNLTTDTQFPGIFLDTHVPKYKELADR